jgi:hypothetical protein
MLLFFRDFAARSRGILSLRSTGLNEQHKQQRREADCNPIPHHAKPTPQDETPEKAQTRHNSRSNSNTDAQTKNIKCNRQPNKRIDYQELNGSICKLDRNRFSTVSAI